ncbi:MAG: hypothetical protein ACOYNY_25090 [Caldilineaceae bacterium]|jgi:hypothetical protein
MTKVYALISAVILFVILTFAPLFFVNQGATDVAVSWNTARTLIDGWTAGPGNWD